MAADDDDNLQSSLRFLRELGRNRKSVGPRGYCSSARQLRQGDGRCSRGAERFSAARLVKDSAALGTLDDVRCQAHQLSGQNSVTAKWAGKGEVEVGFAFEPRSHRPTRPSAVLTGLRIIRCESRPRKTSDGRYRRCSWQSGHLAAIGCDGIVSTGAGIFSPQPLH
jgi:hypothetical protein